MALSQASKCIDEAHAQAVLRHVGRPSCAHPARVGSGAGDDSRPPIEMRPTSAALMPGERLEQLALAVAGDAGDADDLARAQREATSSSTRDAARVAHREVLRPRAPARPAAAGPLSTSSSTLRPTISSASSLGEVVRRCRSVATISPRAHHRDAVGDRHDLAQLVGDEDDRLALRSRSVRSMSNSWSASCGVSTAVGSSRIRMSAPRYSALRISTRCCSPTGRSPTIASGSTSSP